MVQRRYAMKLFGEQIRFVSRVIEARLSFADAGWDRDQLRDRISFARLYPRVVVSIVVSLLIIGIFGAVLVYSPDGKAGKLGAVLIGIVIGYWLR